MPRGTPTELARLRGTMYASRQKRLAQAPGAIGGPPPELTEAAQAVWKATVKAAPEGLLKKIDRDALSVYCTFLAEIKAAQNELLWCVTPSKRTKERKADALALIARHTSIVMRMAKDLCLTPDMRSRTDIPVAATPAPNDWQDVAS